MITFYIDDSGTSDAKDISQPIFLFSGICVSNNDYCKYNGFMKKLINDSDKLIFNKLVRSFELGSRRYNQAMATDIKKGLCTKFELHATEMIHGTKVNRLFSKEEKKNILNSIFEFIKENNIKVLIVKCEKLNLDQSLKKDELQKELNIKMMDGLISLYSKHLETIDDEGVLIFDSGNDIINEHFIDYLPDANSLNLNPNVIQADSKDMPLIQMADFIAYIANIYFNSKSRYYDELKDYYEMIQDNITLLDVTATQTERA